MPADRDDPHSVASSSSPSSSPSDSSLVRDGTGQTVTRPSPMSPVGGGAASGHTPDALPSLDALRAAFDALIRSGALAADAPPPSLDRSPALRAAVAADVSALRARGFLPEAVVIAVKARVRDALRLAAAGAPPTDLAASLIGDRRRRSDEWLACTVTWCIDEYFSRGGERGTEESG